MHSAVIGLQHRSGCHLRESDMSRTFKSSSNRARSGLAVAAVLSTVLVMIAIEGLARHYGGSMQTATTPPIAVASR